MHIFCQKKTRAIFVPEHGETADFEVDLRQEERLPLLVMLLNFLQLLELARDVSSTALLVGLGLLRLLRHAVDNDEFKLMYQPIVDLKQGKIASSEALIRWFPEESDPIRPDIFIPIAEESGHINNIGFWVLDTVSKQAQQ